MTSTPVHLVLRIGSEEHALAIRDVLEVIDPRDRVRVPFSPGVVWGAVNHRGRVYAVVDATLWLTGGQSRYDGQAGARVVLLQQERYRIGIIVHEVIRVGERGDVPMLDVRSLLQRLDQLIDHVSHVAVTAG